MKHTKEEKMEQFGRVLDIMDKLRAKCPWNAAQTWDTLRPMTVEEVYEVSDFDYVNEKWVLKEGVADASAIIGSSYLRPGALKLKADEDGVIRKHVIGNATPDFQGGFALNAYIKGIDISANFTYMIGNDVYNANKVEFTSSRKFYNRNLLECMDVDNLVLLTA